MVVELDLSPDCEAALRVAAEQAGRTVDETVHLAIEAFVEQQDLEQWRAEEDLTAEEEDAFFAIIENL